MRRAAAQPSDPAEPVGAVAADGAAAPTRAGERLRWWAVATFVLVLVPRLATAGRYVTTDEPTWMQRSVRFSDALAHLRLGEATASLGEPATMPGGTTMWLGTIARGLWRAGVGVGWLHGSSFLSPDGLATAQVVHSIATSVLIVVLLVAVARWAGLVAGLVSAVLVGLGPWWVALGAVLHTDELTALLGTIGLVALAHALGVPGRAGRPARPGLVAAGAGLALMGSAMTKVTGAGFWLGAAAIAGWAIWRDRRAGRPLAAPGSPLRLVAIAAACGLAVVPVLWPALVADPAFQVRRLGASIGLSTQDPGGTARRGTRQFFRGEPVDSPGWAYYPVALALRVAPWTFLALLVGVPAGFAWRSTRRFALALLPAIVALFLVLSASPKKFDRYGLVLLAPMAVIAGLAVQRALRDAVAPRTATRVVGGVALVAFAVSLWVAPWGLAYFNPLLGGSSTGEEQLLVGWGEGKTETIEEIRRLEGGDCSGVTIAGVQQEFLLGFPCATFAPATTADYVVVYVSSLQRSPRARAQVKGRELVATVEIRGITYAEIWR
ncbi:MAG: hypothetical protein R2702_19260 [Acidimicrobiales bacterium]